MVLNDKLYKILKWVGLIVTNGLTALWLAIAKAWNLPYTVEIGTTIAAIGAFIGLVVKVSDGNYHGDGEMVINDEDPEKDVYTLQLNTPIEDLGDKKTITFKVKQ